MQSKAGLFQHLYLNKERNAQTLTHTPKTDRQDSCTAHITCVTAETLGGGSEFSVNMHALWLKHLNFPLVPYHTVLHSACSSNRLIGPIISTILDLTKSHKHRSTSPIVGCIRWLPSTQLLHTLSRDTNTSESEGWIKISHLDWMFYHLTHNENHTNMIWPNLTFS